MSKKILEEVSISPSWSSYIGCMDGILRATGYWKDELWKLHGLSGMAFQFIVHEACCPSSVTMYDWKSEHFKAMDRLGLCTEADELIYSPDTQNISLTQTSVCQNIQKSIEKGKSVLVWAPTPCLEFGLIKGYDDEMGAYLVEAVNEECPDPLPYENIGKGEVPILYTQYILDKVPVSIEKTILSSLRHAVAEWKKEIHIQPHYHCGRKAYEALLLALDHPKLSTFGLSYLLSVYQESKQAIYKTLRWICSFSKEFQSIEEASMLFQQVAEHFKMMHEVLPFQPLVKDIPFNEALQKLLRAEIQKARDREHNAMKVIEKMLG